MLKVFKSKKFIVGLITVIGIVVNDVMGKPVSQEAMYSAIGIMATYILGQGMADFSKEKFGRVFSDLDEIFPDEEEMTDPEPGLLEE